MTTGQPAMQEEASVPPSPARAAAEMGPPIGSPSQRSRQAMAMSGQSVLSNIPQAMRDGLELCFERFEGWGKAHAEWKDLEEKHRRLSVHKDRITLPENLKRFDAVQAQKENAKHRVDEQKAGLLQAVSSLFDGFGEKILRKVVKAADPAKDPSHGNAEGTATSLSTSAEQTASTSVQSHVKNSEPHDDGDKVKSKTFLEKLAELVGIEPAEAENRLLSMVKRRLDADSASDATMVDDTANDQASSPAAKSTKETKTAKSTTGLLETTNPTTVRPDDAALVDSTADDQASRQKVEQRLRVLEEKAQLADAKINAQDTAIATLLRLSQEQSRTIVRQRKLLEDNTDVLQNHIVALARHEEFLQNSAYLYASIPSPMYADAEEHPRLA